MELLTRQSMDLHCLFTQKYLPISDMEGFLDRPLFILVQGQGAPLGV